MTHRRRTLPPRWLLAASLTAWCAERLADYKRPRRWLFVEHLPRNAMGKVMKNEVRRLFTIA